jgi:hypothetical protein
MLTLGHALDPDSLQPQGAPATLDPAELTRHAVCVGMTGSGKTGLCIGLLESLAAQGVPVLALDPKGDLANLALALDPSRPDEFVPWVDPGEAARQGLSVEALAAATAAAWAEAWRRTASGPTPSRTAAARSRSSSTPRARSPACRSTCSRRWCGRPPELDSTRRACASTSPARSRRCSGWSGRATRSPTRAPSCWPACSATRSRPGRRCRSTSCSRGWWTRPSPRSGTSRSTRSCRARRAPRWRCS